MKKLVSLPSLLALGLLFGRAHADDGRAIAGFWPAASDVGAAGTAKAHAPTPPTPPTPPSPKTPGVPPVAPVPPVPPPALPGGLNISIHDGKVSIEGIDKFVDEQINNAMKGVNNPGVPPEIQKKVHDKLEKLRTKLKAKLAHIDASNLDQLGDELGDIGDEIGAEMDGFGQDMDAWGEKFGSDMAQKFAKNWKFNSRDDDDHDIPEPPDVDDDGDLDDAVRDLGDLHLNPDQRAKISQIRADSDKQVAHAQHELDTASSKLKALLADPKSNEGQVSAAIDAVTTQENAIRKARVLAWVKARNTLQDDQRAKVEKAAAKKSK